MTARVVVGTHECPVCHKAGTMMLNADKVARWLAGAHVQDVWPDMPAGNREQLMTGIHSDCWDSMFAGDDAA